MVGKKDYRSKQAIGPALPAVLEKTMCKIVIDRDSPTTIGGRMDAFC
jgi:hypothetical protein